MVGAPPQHAPMLDLGFLPIDSSILAGILVHLMHLELGGGRFTSKSSCCADADVPSINFSLFVFFTFAPMFSTHQSVLPLVNNFSL